MYHYYHYCYHYHISIITILIVGREGGRHEAGGGADEVDPRAAVLGATQVRAYDDRA